MPRRRYTYEITLGPGDGRNGMTDAINVAMVVDHVSLRAGRYEVRITRLEEHAKVNFFDTMSCQGCGCSVRVYGQEEPEVVRCVTCGGKG